MKSYRITVDHFGIVTGADGEPMEFETEQAARLEVDRIDYCGWASAADCHVIAETGEIQP